LLSEKERPDGAVFKHELNPPEVRPPELLAAKKLKAVPAAVAELLVQALLNLLKLFRSCFAIAPWFKVTKKKRCNWSDKAEQAEATTLVCIGLRRYARIC